MHKKPIPRMKINLKFLSLKTKKFCSLHPCKILRKSNFVTQTSRLFNFFFEYSNECWQKQKQDQRHTSRGGKTVYLSIDKVRVYISLFLCKSTVMGRRNESTLFYSTGIILSYFVFEPNWKQLSSIQFEKEFRTQNMHCAI